CSCLRQAPCVGRNADVAPRSACSTLKGLLVPYGNYNSRGGTPAVDLDADVVISGKKLRYVYIALEQTGSDQRGSFDCCRGVVETQGDGDSNGDRACQNFSRRRGYKAGSK